MTNLEKMLHELCPNGVEYKSIDNICFLFKGMSGVSNKWAETGNCQFIDYKNVYDNLKVDVLSLPFATVKNWSAQTALKAGDILFTSSSETPDECAISSVIEKEIAEGTFLDDHLFGIRSKTNEYNPTFLNYYFRSEDFRKKVHKTVQGVTRFYVAIPKFMQINVPVPPLLIQQEIVRILDKSTELTAELTEKLTAELTARKKQFNYYRHYLLFSSTEHINCHLPDISENCDSKRKPITGSIRKAGIYPYYGASGIVDYVENYIFDGDYLLISEDGANLLARSAPVAFSISGKNWVNNHAHILKFDNYYTRKYVEYYINATDLAAYITGGAQPKLSQQNLNKLEIPLPPLNEQERIVSILDRFDAFCNDITQDLPAEIEARRKQYEYYRDKLLTFKERQNNVEKK